MERLCAIADLADGDVRRFDVGEHRIALVHLSGQFYALGDRCSHADISLSEGEVLVDECALECWKHGSSFDLRTGEPQSLPATRPVPVYTVKVEGDDVWVELP
ncbi:MAG: non-heme iron oxygenase ferredoxin subunit [Acidimicrobiales bacterium]